MPKPHGIGPRPGAATAATPVDLQLPAPRSTPCGLGSKTSPRPAAAAVAASVKDESTWNALVLAARTAGERLGVRRGSHSAVHRDGTRTEVHLVPPERPELLCPQPSRHREHHVGVQPGTRRGAQEALRPFQGQALGRPTRPSGRRLDKGSHVPADQIPNLAVPDGSLQAQAGDLQAARRQPTSHRVQGLVDVPGRQLPELDLSESLSERLDGVPIKVLGPVGSAAKSVG